VSRLIELLRGGGFLREPRMGDERLRRRMALLEGSESVPESDSEYESDDAEDYDQSVSPNRVAKGALEVVFPRVKRTLAHNRSTRLRVFMS